MTLEESLDQAIAMLQRRGRLTYRALQRQFNLDDDYLEDLKAELIQGQRLAIDEEGAVLVWTGGMDVPLRTNAPASQPGVQPGTSEAQRTQFLPPPDAWQSPDAERRQLTVMFCDLVESTRLASQLDPEELREVVRAYQQVCTAVISQFDGHIAQLLGEGLLVYFGYPQAHEDDAQRAVQSGLGMVEAMQTLNTRLEHEHGIRLAVRVGIHTGLVVVGTMGEGRQEQLAVGETPNVAARVQGLTTADTVVISEATARLVQGYFTWQDLGPHALRGVPAPLQLTPQQQRQQTLQALLAWLLAEAAQQPVLCIIEDLHWVDPSTLEFLGLLVDHGSTARLYSLCTFRPTFTPPWTPRAYLMPMALSHLSPSQTADMVQRVAGGKALPAEVQRQIVAKTDGVPLAVEELTKMMLESGVLQEQEDGYALTGPLPPLAIPTTLHDALWPGSIGWLPSKLWPNWGQRCTPSRRTVRALSSIRILGWCASAMRPRRYGHLATRTWRSRGPTRRWPSPSTWLTPIPWPGRLIVPHGSLNSAARRHVGFKRRPRPRWRLQSSMGFRSSSSLSRLWQSQGKRDEVWQLLEPVYGWFTEGFDTTDLQEAKALLDALA